MRLWKHGKRPLFLYPLSTINPGSVLEKKSILVFRHISKVFALNAQQVKFFMVILRRKLFILIPLFPFNGTPFLGAVPTGKVFNDLDRGESDVIDSLAQECCV